MKLEAKWKCGCFVKEEPEGRIVVQSCGQLSECEVEADWTDVPLGDSGRNGCMFELILYHMRGY